MLHDVICVLPDRAVSLSRTDEGVPRTCRLMDWLSAWAALEVSSHDVMPSDGRTAGVGQGKGWGYKMETMEGT